MTCQVYTFNVLGLNVFGIRKKRHIQLFPLGGPDDHAL